MRPLPLYALLLVACGSAQSTASTVETNETTEVELSGDPVEHAFLRQAERRHVRMTRLAERRFVTPVTAEQVARYRSENDANLRALFEGNRQRWTDMPLQIHARHILVALSGGEPPQAARIRAEQIRRRILGGEDFATVAAAESADEGSAQRGGDLGYFPRGRMVAPFDAAAFSLGDGEVSELVETRFGFHIIRVEGRREGTLSFEMIVPELAERGARNRARRDAMLASADDIVRRVSEGAALDEALAAAFPERPPPTTARHVYLGVPWPFRPEIQEHVASEEPQGTRWVESLEGDREMIILVVARFEPDLADLTPAVAECIEVREANDDCDESYREGPCDACVPEVLAALTTLRHVPEERARRIERRIRLEQRARREFITR